MTTVVPRHFAPCLTDRDHVRCPRSAVVTLLEYGDYKCARCNEARLVVRRLEAALGKQMRFAFRNYPLSSLEVNSKHAAEAAETSGAQNKFWEMHDLLFDQQHALSDKHLRVYATWCGLDMERFNRDMALHTFEFRVREDILSGHENGVHDTPTFLINDHHHPGPYDYHTLLSAMKEFL
ncbi:disulfide bond formation protein DsbA [Acidobacteria bacterium AB60]|nr:disulfide bond formation protein DsbA [Acidobacteria bacterium AB60]